MTELSASESSATPQPDRRTDEWLRHAHAVARRHAELLTDELGDDLVGVYLVGSALLDDTWPGSDIDTVTVVAEPVRDTDALRRVHDRLAEEEPTVRYETIYLPRSWITSPPPDHAATPSSHDGQLQLDGPTGQVHPITWVELARAQTVTGTPVAELSVAVDLDRARSYTRANLTEYWSKVADQLSAAAEKKPADAALTNPAPVVWAVLGAPRLAAFLERLEQRTGDDDVPLLVSKSEAGEWVQRRLPRYADLAGRCLDHRQGRDAAFTVADAAKAAELVGEVIVVANAHVTEARERTVGSAGTGLYRAAPGTSSPMTGTPRPRRGPRGGGMQGQRG